MMRSTKKVMREEEQEFARQSGQKSKIQKKKINSNDHCDTKRFVWTSLHKLECILKCDEILGFFGFYFKIRAKNREIEEK